MAAAAATANDVIYYGLIFRLPSERLSERRSRQRVGSQERKKEQISGGRWSAVHSLTPCSAVGLIYGWEEGRMDGRLVGLVASAL